MTQQLYMAPDGRIVDGLGNEVQVPPGTVPVPMGQASTPNGASPIVSFFTQPMLGVPVWGWALGVVALAGGGYYYYVHTKAKAADAAAGLAQNEPELPEPKWQPSRSRMAERLERWMSQRGKKDGITVYADADEAAAAGVRNPSPLLNLRVARGQADKVADVEMRKMLRREGLDAVQIDANTVGIVPADGTKRGSEWESYVDALREEGQTV